MTGLLSSIGFKPLENEPAQEKLNNTLQDFATEEGGEFMEDEGFVEFSNLDQIVRVFGSLDVNDKAVFQVMRVTYMPTVHEVGPTAPTIREAFKRFANANPQDSESESED